MALFGSAAAAWPLAASAQQPQRMQRIGVVTNMARPGGNITGFTSYEVAIGGKWLELLKEIAPGLNRVAVIYTQGGPGSQGLLHTVEASAPLLGVRTTAIPARDPLQIE